MNAIIESQGATLERPQPGSLSIEIKAPREGVVTAIDNLQMNRIARLAGAPLDKSAGVELLKKVGDPLSPGDPLYRIFAQFKADFRFACSLAEKDNGYGIGTEEEIPGAFVEN
jgi:thymidine phosphorylase